MAFTIKLNEPSGILFLMLLALPLVTANIDCNGRPFHCVNSTHFMICVDLGSGVSSTLDDFVIPCPPATVCQGNNRFECEFPTVSTQAPQLLETITVQTTNIDQATEVSQNIDATGQATTSPSNTVTIPFEEYYNTFSSTTLSQNEISTLIPITTTDFSVTDVFESLNIATFGSRANLETVGSSATQVLTTETQINQTEFLKTSISLPENVTLQTPATAIDSTTAVTESSTNLDTITTPVNEINTNTLNITTSIPYLTSITGDDSQTTQTDIQFHASQSAPPNDENKIYNTTHEIKSTPSSYVNVTSNEGVTTDNIQPVTDVVSNVDLTQVYQTIQTKVESLIRDTDLNSNVLTTEPPVYLTTTAQLSLTDYKNKHISEKPVTETDATTEPHTVGFENIIDTQNNKTVPTEPSTELNQLTVSTLSPSTDSISLTETITTDEIGVLPSAISTTDGNMLLETNISTVKMNNFTSPEVTNTVGNAMSTSYAKTSTPRITAGLKPTETLLTTNDLTTSTREVKFTGGNTIFDTSGSTPPSVEMKTTIANYGVMNAVTDKIAFESNSQFTPNYDVTEKVLSNSDSLHVTDTTEPLFNIAYIHENKISYLEAKDQIQNETLLFANKMTPTEKIVTNENSNFTTQSLGVTIATTQQTTLSELNSPTNLPETTAETITGQTLVFEDTNNMVLQNTKTVIIDNGNVNKQKTELNRTITQPADINILTTMSLQNTAEQPLELTTATNIEGRVTVTDIESSTIIYQSTTVSSNSKLNESDGKNNSVSLDSNIQSTSNFTTSVNLETESTSRYYPTISSVTGSVDSSYDIPIVTIATPSENNTKPSLLSTISSYFSTVVDAKQLTLSSPQIQIIPTTEVLATTDQNKTNIENNNVIVNIDNNQITTPYTVESNSNLVGNVKQSATEIVNNVFQEDIRNKASKENKSQNLDNVSPMTNSAILSHNLEPVQSHTVASAKLSYTDISNDPMSANGLDDKYQNVISENNSGSTNIQRVDPTPASAVIDSKISVKPIKVDKSSSYVTDAKIFVEPAKVNKSVSYGTDAKISVEPIKVNETSYGTDAKISGEPTKVNKTASFGTGGISVESAKVNESISYVSDTKIFAKPAKVIEPASYATEAKISVDNTKINEPASYAANVEISLEPPKVNESESYVSDSKISAEPAKVNGLASYATEAKISVDNTTINEPASYAANVEISLEPPKVNESEFYVSDSKISAEPAKINELASNATEAKISVDTTKIYEPEFYVTDAKISVESAKENESVSYVSDGKISVEPAKVNKPASNATEAKIFVETTKINKPASYATDVEISLEPPKVNKPEFYVTDAKISVEPAKENEPASHATDAKISVETITKNEPASYANVAKISLEPLKVNEPAYVTDVKVEPTKVNKPASFVTDAKISVKPAIIHVAASYATDAKISVETTKINEPASYATDDKISLEPDKVNKPASYVTDTKISIEPAIVNETAYSVTDAITSVDPTKENTPINPSEQNPNEYNRTTLADKSSNSKSDIFLKDDILKTNNKDTKNLNTKPTDKVSHIERDMPTLSNNKVGVEISNIKKDFHTNQEYKTTTDKFTDDKIQIYTTVSSRTSKAYETVGMIESTKGYVNTLSNHPKILEDHVKNIVDKLKPTNDEIERAEPREVVEREEIETPEAKEVAEGDIKPIPQLPKQEQPVIDTKITPKDIINITPHPTTTTPRAVVNQFLCNPYLRGRFADNHDCRKFYICIGRLQPMEGICPINTVFSEIRKQCTKNLSHCVRNNQFQCVSQGRFSDFLNDNFYYICVKNKLNHFIRFKLRCQNGYHLNKTSVQCVLNTETSQSISVSSDKSISDQSGPLARLKKKKASGDFECEKEGKFADPNDCRIYYVCKITSNSEFRRKKKKCDSDEHFHNDKKRCVDAESYECKS